MLSPEQSQVATCLLKVNLEEIENEFVDQLSVLPELDAEHEQKVKETLQILREVRSLGAECEQLKQENVRLVAKRMQLKRQGEEAQRNLDKAREHRAEMEQELGDREQQMDADIRKYEDSLREKAERFKNTRGYYNEDEVNVKIGKAEAINVELERDINEIQKSVKELKVYLEKLQPEIPEDLLQLVGSNEIEDKMKSLTKEIDELQKRKDQLFQNSN